MAPNFRHPTELMMLELNFEELYARSQTLPLRRVRTPGESFWARELKVEGKTYAILDNSPLDETYMLFDVTEVRPEGILMKVVYRPFPKKVWFNYEAAPTEEEEEDVQVRGKLRDVFVQAARPLMGFFVSGLAYVQCHEQDDFAEALTAAGLKTTLNGWTPPKDADHEGTDTVGA